MTARIGRLDGALWRPTDRPTPRLAGDDPDERDDGLHPTIPSQNVGFTDDSGFLVTSSDYIVGPTPGIAN